MEASRERSRLLGEIFVEKGLLSEEELEDVLAEQSRTGRRIGQIVVARGLVSGPALTTVLTEQLGVELETERGFGSGLWTQIARRHERGLGTSGESPAETEDAPTGGGDLEGPVEEPTLEELAERLAALETRLGTERATREQAESELAEARRELAELAGAASASGFLVYVTLDGGFAVVERDGEPPQPGAQMEVRGLGRMRFVVDTVERSPFPLDPRLCAYLHAAPTEWPAAGEDAGGAPPDSSVG